MSEGPRNMNLLTGRTDGSHIPPMALWIGVLRVVQLVFSLIVLALCAYSASLFVLFYNAWAMGIFTWIWTWLVLAYIIISALFVPKLYNIWAHIVLEALTVLWWLVSFALLATLAAVLGSYNGNSAWRAGMGATGAAAAFGAFTWVAFVVTLVFSAIGAHKHRKANLVASNGGPVTDGSGPVDPEAAAHKMTPMATGSTVPQAYASPAQAQYQPVEAPQAQYYGSQQVPVQGQQYGGAPEQYGNAPEPYVAAGTPQPYGAPAPYGQSQQTHYGA